jgi:type IV secretory pathway VirB10-like protein
LTADRFEWSGVGAALLFHVALIAALSLSLARANKTPEAPSMEVELVDEVALDSAAPQAVSPPSSAAPPIEQLAAPEPDQSAPATPPVAMPTPRPTPQPIVRPTPQPQRAKPRPAPKPAPAKPVKRAGLGDDFLSKLDDDLSPRGEARPAAPTYSAKARTSVANSIAAQAQRCADRQPYLGDGADEIRVNVKLFFAQSGRLSRPPVITSMTGPSDAKAKYGELLEDQVRRIFVDCSPFKLPADLYDTDNGGWKQTTIRYGVKK